MNEWNRPHAVSLPLGVEEGTWKKTVPSEIPDIPTASGPDPRQGQRAPRKAA